MYLLTWSSNESILLISNLPNLRFSVSTSSSSLHEALLEMQPCPGWFKLDFLQKTHKCLRRCNCGGVSGSVPWESESALNDMAGAILSRAIPNAWEQAAAERNIEFQEFSLLTDTDVLSNISEKTCECLKEPKRLEPYLKDYDQLINRIKNRCRYFVPEELF